MHLQIFCFGRLPIVQLSNSIAGESTNQAESFFSRLRRMLVGQTHRFGNNYLDRYAREAAYCEDTHCKPSGFIFADVMKRFAQFLPSRDFYGYWQGNKKDSINLIGELC